MCARPMTFRPVSGPMEGREVQGVACRRCYECLCARQTDMVGRCIAEAKVAVATRIVHLTYRDASKATNLSEVGEERKREIQLWLKRIRKKYDVRYLVSAEYGDRNGRLHFHCILFFQSAPPALQGTYQGDRPNNADPYWPHGRTVWDDLGSGANAAAAIRYACYYVVKGLDDIRDYEDGTAKRAKPQKLNSISTRQASLMARGRWPKDESGAPDLYARPEKPVRPVPVHLRYVAGKGGKGGNKARRTWYTCSTRPALGCRYFTREAQKYVDAGLVPQKAEYWFPDVPTGRNKTTGEYNRRPFVFRLQKASATMLHFVREFERLWNERHPGRDVPRSELIDYVHDHHSKQSGWRAELPVLKDKDRANYYPPEVPEGRRLFYGITKFRGAEGDDLIAPVLNPNYNKDHDCTHKVTKAKLAAGLLRRSWKLEDIRAGYKTFIVPKFLEPGEAAPNWPDPERMPDGETLILVKGRINPAIPARERPWFSPGTMHWHIGRLGDPGARVWSWDADGQPGWVARIVGNTAAARRRRKAIAADKPLWLPKRERIARDRAAKELAKQAGPIEVSASWYASDDEIVQRVIAGIERHFGPLSAKTVRQLAATERVAS